MQAHCFCLINKLAIYFSFYGKFVKFFASLFPFWKRFFLFSFVLSVLTVEAWSQDELIFSADLLRHGARVANHQLDNIEYPDTWFGKNIPKGQLTLAGFFAEQANGRAFAQRYSSLLPRRYSADLMCVRTDGSNRTIMSALAVLAAWFPRAVQPVLDTVPEQNDTLLKPNKKAMYRAVNSLPGWQSMWQRSHYGYRYFQQLKKMGKLQEICPLQRGRLAAYQACFAPLHRLADSAKTISAFCALRQNHCRATALLGLSSRALHQLNKVDARLTLLSLQPSSTRHGFQQLSAYERVGREGGCPLVSEVIHDMQQRLQGKTMRRYVLYSGHDTTIKAVLNALLLKAPGGQLTVQDLPRFAADLSFALWRRARGQLWVSVRYYNGPKLAAGVGRLLLDMSWDDFKKRYFHSACLQIGRDLGRCDYF